MRVPDIFGIGLQGKSPVITAQRRLNTYFEFQPQQDQTLVSVLGTPGLNLKLDLGDTPIRGALEVGSLAFLVHRGTLWEVNNAFSKTNRGTLNTTTGRVDMAYNGSQILIVDGTNGYIFDTDENTFAQVKQYSTGTTTSTSSGKLVDSSATFQTDGVTAGQIVYNDTDSTTATVSSVDSETQLTLDTDIFTSGESYTVGDPDFPDGAATCAFLDTYFIVELNGNYYISGANNGFVWDALDFGVAESEADDILRVFSDHGDLILFGVDTTEYHGNTGAVDFPFSAVQGTRDEWGLVAKWSLAKYDNSLMYLAKNTMGEVMLVRSSGYTPQPIVDFEFNHKINGYSVVSDATGLAYLLGGHPMYQINFPTEGKSWLYDGATNIFTELKSKGIDRHRAEIFFPLVNKNYVTDYTLGRVYQIDPSTYDDNGDTILRQIRSKHLFSPNGSNLIVDEVELLMETGVGLATGQGSDPQVMLRISKDKGRTWGNEMWRDIGQTGEYLTRIIWNSLGYARDWVFEISISDPIKVVIVGVNIKAREANA